MEQTCRVNELVYDILSVLSRVLCRWPYLQDLAVLLRRALEYMADAINLCVRRWGHSFIVALVAVDVAAALDT